MIQYSLRELRARTGERQQDIADLAGVSVQTYGRWEKDPQKTPVGKIAIIAKHFKMSLDEIQLAGGAGDE